MKLNSKNMLVFFLLFLAGSAVGFLVGVYSGSNFGMGLILNNSLGADAQEVQVKVDALRQLRHDNPAQAIELLEASLDDQLVIFDPREPYPGLRDDTIATIDIAIRSAADYRARYPRQSNRPHVDTMVRNLFEKHQRNP